MNTVMPSVATIAEEVRTALEDAVKAGLDVDYQNLRFYGPPEEAMGVDGKAVKVKRQEPYRVIVIKVG